MISEDIYDEIYITMKISSEKGLKMVLRKNFQGVLLTNISNVDPLLDSIEKNYLIYCTQTRINTLINNLILENENRGKIKL